MMTDALCLSRVRYVHVVLLILMLFLPGMAHSQPAFSKVFIPSTIGPGSITTLRFDITNPYPTPVTDLAFTDVRPPLPN